jgi:hypothetical protein
VEEPAKASVIEKLIDDVVATLQYFQASSLQCFREATVLRFVTSVGEGGYCVTGRMEIGGGPTPSSSSALRTLALTGRSRPWHEFERGHGWSARREAGGLWPRGSGRSWPVSPSAHPSARTRPRSRVYERLLRILHGNVSQVVKGIRSSSTKRGLPPEGLAVVMQVTGYLYRNRRRMAYDAYLREGLPIASGSVEGACKNLVKDRMERSGCAGRSPWPKPCSACERST